MEIVWHGHSCFRMSERGLASIVTDPYEASLGYPPLKLKADIVTISHAAAGHNNVDAVRGEKLVIAVPGEFEIGGVFITGIATDGDQRRRGADAKRNILYLFDFGGLTVCHLGDLQVVPTQAQMEALGPVDVVLVPVGGGGGLNAAPAAEVISLLEPSVVVPMHYQTEPVTLKLDPVSKFLKEMGQAALQPEPSLKLSKSSLPDETRVVLLDYRSD